MELIKFKATDNVKLEGLMYEVETSQKVILSVHGMTSNCFKDRETIIAKEANNKGISYFGFNNRGSELVKYIRKQTGEEEQKLIGGTSYEDVLDGYFDILGALEMLKQKGYTEIYLQGHSLGATKVVYTYNKLKEEKHPITHLIKGIILLSLVDIPMTLQVYLKENFLKYVEIAKQKQNILELMPREAFIHPISAKSFLRYAVDNKEIDFAGYGRDEKLEKLNSIDKPFFMRWGNVNEMILQKADDLVNMLNNIIKQEGKNINYINNADHGYTGKEEELAKEIIQFIL